MNNNEMPGLNENSSEAAVKRESILSKHGLSMFGGIALAALTALGIKSGMDMANNPDNQKFANENHKMKDIQKTYHNETKENLEAQVREINEKK